MNASTSILTGVPASTSSVTLLGANPGRLGAILFNNSTSELSLLYGSPASATSFTMTLGPGDTWTNAEPVYTGAITGIWATADGACQVTELTA